MSPFVFVCIFLHAIPLRYLPAPRAMGCCAAKAAGAQADYGIGRPSKLGVFEGTTRGGREQQEMQNRHRQHEQQQQQQLKKQQQQQQQERQKQQQQQQQQLQHENGKIAIHIDEAGSGASGRDHRMTGDSLSTCPPSSGARDASMSPPPSDNAIEGATGGGRAVSLFFAEGDISVRHHALKFILCHAPHATEYCIHICYAFDIAERQLRTFNPLYFYPTCYSHCCSGFVIRRAWFATSIYPCYIGISGYV